LINSYSQTERHAEELSSASPQERRATWWQY